MAEHVSALALDSLAGGLPVEPSTSTHVAGCAVCSAKLEALKAERAALILTPQFSALMTKLAAVGPSIAAPAAAPAKKFPRWAPVLLALAAALLLLVGPQLFPRDDGTILKGAQTVELLDSNGKAVTSAHLGDRLALAVGGAGAGGVVVFGIDDRGDVVVLVTPMAIPRGARVPTGKIFEVTPGSFTVVACFGTHPVPVDALKSQLFRRGSQKEKSPRDVVPPDGCAKTTLEVLP